jgi:predicted alpha/beta hydrolase family esterase
MSNTKHAAIFHGTGDSPEKYWLPWIKRELEQSGYEVYAPVLPQNSTPDKDIYETFIRASNWDFTDNVLIGHSSGATTILNLLSAEWFPHVKAVVLVGTFLNEKLTKSVSWYAPGQFDHLFLPHYDPSIIKQKADRFYFVHGDNDPYCDINDVQKLSDEVGGVFITIPNGHHLGGTSNRAELPELKDVLSNDSILDN